MDAEVFITRMEATPAAMGEEAIGPTTATIFAETAEADIGSMMEIIFAVTAEADIMTATEITPEVTAEADIMFQIILAEDTEINLF